MSGLENIKSRILDEANHSAQMTIDEARRETEQLLDKARREADEAKKKILSDAAKKVKDMEDRAASALDMEKRKELLRTKRALIEDVLNEAYTRLSQDKNESYFGLLLQLVEKYAEPQDGTIRFCASDASALTDEFLQKVMEAARAKGGSLTVGEPVQVDAGFVLVYGGIEENCTVKALFDARYDELADEVNRLLFTADA